MSLNCPSCCTCPTPLFAYISRAATKSKCGAVDLAQPGKWFLSTTETFSQTGTSNVSFSDTGTDGEGGTSVNTSSCTVSLSTSWTVTTTYNATTCAASCTYSGTSSCVGSSGQVTVTTGGAYPGTFTSGLTGNVSGTMVGCNPAQWHNTGVTTEYRTSTVDPDSDDNIPSPVDYVGSAPNACIPCGATPAWDAGTGVATDTFTYADEFTTDLLQTSTEAALPSWGSISAPAGEFPPEVASAELSLDESSFSILESKYRFFHPISPTSTYKIAWVERFTPDDGSPVIDTPQTYTWNGVTPSGYNPSDATTWPNTPTAYEVDYPSSNGKVTINKLTVDCGGGPTQIFA